VSTPARARPVDLTLAGFIAPGECGTFSDDLTTPVIEATLSAGMGSGLYVCLRNTGGAANQPITVTFNVTDVSDIDVGCTDLEADFDQTCGNNGPGEAKPLVTLVYAEFDCSAGTDVTGYPPFSFSQPSNDMTLIDNQVVNTRCFRFMAYHSQVPVAEALEQAGQSDKLSFTLTFKGQYAPTLVANPGPFAFEVSGGELQAFAGSYPVPGGGLTGEIDVGGHITAPASNFQLDDVPFDETQDLSGIGNVRVFGTASFASAGISGDLDPAVGTMSLTDSAYASVTFTATADGVTLYSGTCNFGTPSAPIPLTLHSTTPYSESTGAVTLQASFDGPDFVNCNPDPGFFSFVLGLFAGSDSLTLTGTTNPVINAP
jgi:hypothetical protein